MSALLQARGLRVTGPSGAVLVDGVDLDLAAGEVTALVGESGAGKSLTGLALLGLVPPPARMEAGGVTLGGVDLGALPPRERRRTRGAGIALVPQDPAAALDPVVRVGAQLAEVLRAHAPLGRAEARASAAAALAEVGVDRDDHPHRLSGGQRQRALIAMALAPRPRVLVADEPTASLDAAVQVAVLDLIDQRRRAEGLAVLLISHDLGSVARIAGRVAVMYAGRIVEEGPVRAVLSAPRHPYTAGLLALAPRLGSPGTRVPIPGAPPRPGHLPPGCPFAPRCPAARAACTAARPGLGPAGPGRRVACVLTHREAAALGRTPA
ncbi:MAG: ABC transporter ATP-binding protein [Thermoleophilia bacterium]|nr:ABC transporter ATP-binding protein [Thermoleophilia bacterium]